MTIASILIIIPKHISNNYVIETGENFASAYYNETCNYEEYNQFNLEPMNDSYVYHCFNFQTNSNNLLIMIQSCYTSKYIQRCNSTKISGNYIFDIYVKTNLFNKSNNNDFILNKIENFNTKNNSNFVFTFDLIQLYDDKGLFFSNKQRTIFSSLGSIKVNNFLQFYLELSTSDTSYTINTTRGRLQISLAKYLFIY